MGLFFGSLGSMSWRKKMRQISLAGCFLLLVTACGGDEQNQLDTNLLPSTESNINYLHQTCENTVTISTLLNGEKSKIPDWLSPPAEGALVAQVLTTYINPITCERYDTNTAGYTILIK